MLMIQPPWLASEICQMAVASFLRLWLLRRTLYQPRMKIVSLVNFTGLECLSLVILQIQSFQLKSCHTTDDVT